MRRTEQTGNGAGENVLEQHELAGVLLDGKCSILRSVGDLERFLAAGDASLQERAAAGDACARTLLELVTEVFASGRPACALPDDPSEPGASFRVDGDPVTDAGGQVTACWVTFAIAGKEATIRVDARDDPADLEEARTRIAELQAELHASRERLQFAITALQSSNRELAAANAEISESNEELQRANEELQTVNAEYEQQNRLLRELDDDHHTLLDQLSFGVLFVGDDLRIRKMNPFMQSLLRLNDNPVGQTLQWALTGIETGERIMREIRSVLRAGDRFEREIQGPDKRMLLKRISPVRDKKRKIQGAVLTLTDITEIRSSESRLALAMETPRFVFWEWDVPADIMRFHARNADLFAGRGGEVVEMNLEAWFSYIHADDRERMRKVIKEHLSGERKEIKAELRIQAPGDRWIWMEFSGRVVSRDAGDRPVQVLGLAQDINRRKQAELSYRASEERFRSAFDYSAIGMALVSESQQILEVNRSVLEMFGYTADWYREASLMDLVVESERESVEGFLKRLLRGETEHCVFEARLRHAGGYALICRLNVAVLAGSRSGGYDFIFQIQDVTESRRAKQRLLEQRRLLEETGRLARIGGWEMSVQADELRWSNELYRIHEVDFDFKPTLEDVLGFFPPKSRERLRQAMKRCVAGERFKLVLPMKSEKGTQLTVRMEGHPIFENGEVVRVQGLLQDITEYRRLESERQAFFETSLDMLSVSRVDGGFMLVNPAWRDTLGWKPEEVLAAEPLEFVHPEDVEATRAQIPLIRDHGTLRGYQNRMRDREGNYHWLSWNAVYDPERHLIYAVARDITPEKRLQKELIDAKERAESANQAKTQFLAMMSHELRTPLNPIIGYAQLLIDEEQDGERADMLQAILDAGDHLLRIISDLLDLSRIESGRIQLEESLFNVQELIREVCSIMHSPVTERGLDFVARSLEEDEDVPPLLGDVAKLRQVLVNLLGNAAKFTPKGTVEFRSRFTRLPDGRVKLYFEVQDSGVGIPEDKLDEIFEPFHQVDSSQTRRFGGSGLGLSICRKLVEVMNGEIGVRSELGSGSLFWFYVVLPAADAAQAGEHPQKNAPTGTTKAIGNVETHADETGEAATTSVLVVDSNEEQGHELLDLLESAGLRSCFWVADAAEALERAQTRRYDIVFIDLRVTGVDGLETARQLRSHLGDRCPFLVAVSAHAGEDEHLRCLEGGMHDFIARPFDINDLEAVLDRYPGRRRGQ